MKIVLTAINAKYIHSNLAVRYLKKYAEREHDCKIDILEFTINNYTDDILKEINAVNPDVIGFSCYIWNIELVKKLCTLLKIIRPELKIILGGPEVSYNIEEVFASCNADFILYGEGERSFSELTEYFYGRKTLCEIDGLAYRADGEIIVNKPAKPLDMAELPFPYEDFTALENRIIYYEASRGCPFSCQYCLSSIEKGVRTAPIDKVKRELSVFLNAKVPQVKLVDRTFNCKKTFAMEIIAFLIENDNGFTNFHFEVAADLMDDDMLTLLGSARKGLFQLEIGVQSTNPDTLSAVSRTNDFEHISYCVKKLHEYDNINLHLDLIAGLPCEDIKSFEKSFDDVHALAPHQLQLGFLKVLKGSGMKQLADTYKIRFSPYPPYEVLSTDCLSYDDIIILKGVEEMTELYRNSGRFTYSLGFLLKNTSSPFKLYRSMSNYMKQTNSRAILTGKLLPYRFLLDYAAYSGIDTERLRWLIRYDMLLHENTSTIPDWLGISFDKQREEVLYRSLVGSSKLAQISPEYAEMPLRRLVKLIHLEVFPFNPNSEKSGEIALLFKYHKKNSENCAEVFEIKI